MLPSRGIARSLPSVGAGRQLHGRRATTGVAPTSVVSKRQLGTGRPLGNSLLRTGGSPFAARRHVAAPVLLGAAMTPRAFSLWGFGKATPPTDASDAVTTATAVETPKEEAAVPVDPTPEPVVSDAPPTDLAVATSDADLSSISDLINAQDILSMPEQLGYLHAIGLDYGWGPTSIMQWILEHVHVYTGLGWAASFAATALILRVAAFYPQIRALRFGAKMQKMKDDPRLQEASTLVREGLSNKDPAMAQRGRFLSKALREQYGVSNFGLLWSFAHLPFTYGMFRLVSGMTHIPVPALETGGYLWFHNLTASDPYFILPAVSTGLMICSVMIGSKTGPPGQAKTLKPLMWIMGSVGFVVTCFLSAAINFMTLTVSAATLGTNLLLSIRRLRTALNLPCYDQKTLFEAPKPIYSPPRAPAPAEPTAPKSLRQRLTNNLDDAKKGFNEQVSTWTGTHVSSDLEKAERRRKELLNKLEHNRKIQEREEFARKYKKQ